MGLHDDPNQLRTVLGGEIERLSSINGVEAVLLAYGLCGRGIIGLCAAGVPLVVPRAHDCIAILLGGQPSFERAISASPATYFYSPGWARGLRVPGPDRDKWMRSVFEERYPDDPEMVDDLMEADAETFEHYSRAGFVDFTGNNSAADYCRACAQSRGWRFEHLGGDPSMLRDLLRGNWDVDRFLVVEPGWSIVAGSGREVLRAEPRNP